MEKVIAKLGKENHLNSLMNRLPFLTLIYALQCLLVYHMAKEINLGDFALYMGLSLIFLICSLFIYDKYHHILLYKDHLLVYFEPLNHHRKIYCSEIKEIITPKQECDFSSIMLILKDEKSSAVSLHFIDYPLQVKKVMEQLISQDQKEKETPSQDVA